MGENFLPKESVSLDSHVAEGRMSLWQKTWIQKRVLISRESWAALDTIPYHPQGRWGTEMSHPAEQHVGICLCSRAGLIGPRHKQFHKQFHLKLAPQILEHL